MPPEKERSKRSLKFLNGVRGLAGLMVLIPHTGLTTLSLGQCGVDLFFVLSAFLLTFLLYQKMYAFEEEERCVRDWGLLLLSYGLRRFMRVYPLFVITAVIVGLLPEEDRQNSFFTKGKPYELGYVLIFDFPHRWHIFWTLPLELFYYSVIPPLCFAMLKLRHFKWILCAGLLGNSIYLGLTTYHAHHMPVWPHVGTFLAGSVAGIAYVESRRFSAPKWYRPSLPEKFRSYDWIGRIVWDIQGFFILSLILSIITERLLFSWVFAPPFRGMGGNQYTAFLVSLLIWKEALWSSSISRFLEWNFLCFCGKICYPLYLLHSFPIYLWNSQVDVYDRAFFSLLGSIGLASVVHYVIEKPIMIFTDWMCRKLKGLEKGPRDKGFLPLIVCKGAKDKKVESDFSNLTSPLEECLLSDRN